MVSELTWGELDGEPFVIARSASGRLEGCWLVRDASDSKWTKVNAAGPFHEGRVLSKASFDKTFPSLPPLPSALRHSFGKPDNTSPKLTWGVLDGEPFVIAEGSDWIKGWLVRNASDSKWSEANVAELSHQGRVLSKASFDKTFPSVPPLPSALRHSSDKPDDASPN